MTYRQVRDEHAIRTNVSFQIKVQELCVLVLLSFLVVKLEGLHEAAMRLWHIKNSAHNTVHFIAPMRIVRLPVSFGVGAVAVRATQNLLADVLPVGR